MTDRQTQTDTKTYRHRHRHRILQYKAVRVTTCQSKRQQQRVRDSVPLENAATAELVQFEHAEAGVELLPVEQGDPVVAGLVQEQQTVGTLSATLAAEFGG